MELLEKTSMPVYKQCRICLQRKSLVEFYVRGDSPDGYRNDCKVCFIQRIMEHDRTPRGQQLKRQRGLRYYYSHIDKCREYEQYYRHTPRGMLAAYKKRAKFHKTEKYRMDLERFYAKHGSRCAYERENYHRIQEEAGCHMTVVDFYPAYKFLKALETAEIVEVKDA